MPSQSRSRDGPPTLTRAASMRRPADVNNNLWAVPLGASPPTHGRRHGVRPFFPLKGQVFFFALAASPGFHSHSWWSNLLRCQLGSLLFNGCCHLWVELSPPYWEAVRSAAPSQSPELGLERQRQTILRRPALCGAAEPCCSARVRRLPRSPTRHATTPPASMRRPAGVNNNLWAVPLGASPPTHGRRHRVRPFSPFQERVFSSLPPQTDRPPAWPRFLAPLPILRTTAILFHGRSPLHPRVRPGKFTASPGGRPSHTISGSAPCGACPHIASSLIFEGVPARAGQARGMLRPRARPGVPLQNHDLG